MSMIEFGTSYVRRMPVYLLLECGDSMSGAPIMAVEQGIQLVHNQLLQQPQAVELINLSVIAYSTYAQQLIPLTPITAFGSPSLSAGGVRNYRNAFQLLGDCIFHDLVKNTATTKGDYMANVFWVTDGEPVDDWKTGLDYLKQRTDGLLGTIVAFGVGDAFNTTLLHQITPNVISLIDVTPETFLLFLKWTSQPPRR